MHLLDGLGSGLGLSGGGIDDVERAIKNAIVTKENSQDRSKVMLVLDGLDFLVAATGCEVQRVLDMIGELREVCVGSKY